MKNNYRKAFNELKKLGVFVYIHPDDEERFDISAEEPNSDEWVNYYSDIRPSNWDFGINPIIDEILTKHNLYCEWVNPAHVRIYDL